MEPHAHKHRFERVDDGSGSSVYRCACGARAEGPELHWKLRRARRAKDVATLTAGLDDPIEGMFAARFLGDSGASESIPELEGRLRSTDPHMRAATLIALGKLHAVSAGEKIEGAAVSDSVQWVRAAAVEAAEGVLPPDRLRALLHRALADPGWNARFVAARILERTGEPSDLPSLQAAKKTDVWWRRGVYRKAIRAIRRRSGRS